VAIAYVNSWSANGFSIGATSNTLTAPGTQTSGNLLVAVVGLRSNASGASFSATGWTKVHESVTGNVGGALFYRIASGTSADDFAASWGITKRWVMAVSEFSGVDTTNPLETSNENESQVSSSTTTVTTGSVTPTTAGLAVAAFMADLSNTWAYSDITIDSSFTKAVTEGNNVTARPGCAMAYLDLSDTSAQNPTWTSAISVAGTYAAIAVFKEAGGGVEVDSALESIGLSTFAAEVKSNRDIIAALESIILSESSAQVALDVGISAGLESVEVSTNQSSVALDAGIDATTEVLTLSTFPGGVQADFSLTTATEGLVIGPFSSTIQLGNVIGASLESIQVETYQSSVDLDVSISGSLETIELSGQQASVSLGASIDATIESLVVTTNPGSITLEGSIQALTEQLTLSTFSATIVGGDLVIVAGLEYTLPDNLMGYTLPINLAGYTFR
jgi:hypothetical protein